MRHGAPGEIAGVRADLERRPERLAIGPWAVAHAVCDHVVNSYVEVAASMENDIDALEEHVFGRHTPGSVGHIYQLKRELMEFRRAVVPLQRPMATLVGDRTMPEAICRHFADVGEELQRTVERAQSYDELLNSVLQARLAQVAVDQNRDQRKIASWAAIALVQTVIAGIYGMNFKYMPELDLRYGYAIVLAVMLTSAIALYRGFRRSGWL